MSDDDVTEVEVVLDGVRFYVEARQDSTEHEVGSTLTEGLGSAMDAIKTLGNYVTDAVKVIEPDHFSVPVRRVRRRIPPAAAGARTGAAGRPGRVHRAARR